MSNLPSYNLATARLMSDSDESISLRNNNVMNQNEQQDLQQKPLQDQNRRAEKLQQKNEDELQQQQLLQQQQQHQSQPQISYPDPPYLIRNSRAFRHLNRFRNPPQPHMCIKDHTDDGQELFINVMSWTKICMPNSEADPIPLYGGMRVTSGRPLMFAVMANPAILKHVGRKCSDVEEKYALVKLMCDFVEAMNPGLKLARDAEVLKDRDLSGELKDIWGAVQAKRLREKDSAPSYESYLASQNQVYIDFGPTDAPPYQQQERHTEQSKQLQQQPLPLQLDPIKNSSSSKESKSNQSISVLNVDEVDNNTLQQAIDSHQNNLNVLDNNTHMMMMSTTANNRSATNNQQPHSNKEKSSKTTTQSVAAVTPSSNDTDSNKNDRQATKREKLSGFLPNSCHNIFPFIKTKSSGGHDKNGAHKEKNDSNQKNVNANQQQHQQQQQQQQPPQSQQHSNNITRKILYGGKDNNKLIQNNDTANLESEISKLDIGKI